MRYSSYIPFPVLQFRKLGRKVGPDLLRQPGFIGHVALQKIQQLLQAGVDKLSVGIAPFAVLLIEGAIWLPADIGVLQRHTTALADQLPGRAKRGVDGDIKQPGKLLQSFCIGHCISGKPPAGSHVLVPPTAPGRVRAWCAVPEGFLWYPYRSLPYPNHTTTGEKAKQPAVAPGLLVVPVSLIFLTNHSCAAVYAIMVYKHRLLETATTKRLSQSTAIGWHSNSRPAAQPSARLGMKPASSSTGYSFGGRVPAIASEREEDLQVPKKNELLLGE